MSDIICVTNRHLCREQILQRVEALAKARPRAIILREKDLSPAEYRQLAEEALAICAPYGTPCVLHGFAGIARELKCPSLHLPLAALRELGAAEKACFNVIGASCHSAEEAEEAAELGCSYITAGHIFDTDCKRGLPGRGLEYLARVCRAVSLPVYAIGGVTANNVTAARQAGAAGACVMSGAMICTDPAAYLAAFEDTK